MKLLVVEDDKIIGDGLKKGLELQGYVTEWVEDKRAASTAIEAAQYDLIVLDVGLPDGSGLDLLAKIRRSKNSIPVLILTAYDDISDRVKGLDGGADDYMIKPFDLLELCARVRALLRRSNGSASAVLEVGEITLDPATHRVCKQGEAITIGPKEFALLEVLMSKAGKVVSKQQLEESLYGWDSDIGSNTVEVHIHGLRKKLGKDFIKTIRHVGYQISHDEK